MNHPTGSNLLRSWRVTNTILFLGSLLLPAGGLPLALLCARAARSMALFIYDPWLRMAVAGKLVALAVLAAGILLMLSPLAYAALNLAAIARPAFAGAGKLRTWLRVTLAGSLLFQAGIALMLLGGAQLMRTPAVPPLAHVAGWLAVISALALEASQGRLARGTLRPAVAGAAALAIVAGAGLAPLAPRLFAPPLALVNGVLIDGSGADPVPDAALVIRSGRIAAVGPRDSIAIPAGARVIDVQGGTILPGFINTHVHDAFDGEALRAWAQGGVTTVRDSGILSTAGSPLYLTLRDLLLAPNPGYARLVSSGMMMSPYGGYGQLQVRSQEEAVRRTYAFLDNGAEAMKVSLETGYAGRGGLPLLSRDELRAVAAAAHARGKPLSIHVTDSRELAGALEVGVDDIQHIVYDAYSPADIQRTIEQGILYTPTLTVMEAYGALSGSQRSLKAFVNAGGRIALGNDYTRIPQNGFAHFDLGMPMHEIRRMSEVGLTPMQIIVSGTSTAAEMLHLLDELGTLEPGKLADVLVVQGDPLADLAALDAPLLVIHGGVIIRNPP